MRRILAAVLAMLLMTACAPALADDDAEVLLFEMDVVVTCAGGLDVTETLAYRVTDDINGFTRDIDPSFGTGVDGFSAAIATPDGEVELRHDPDARRGDSGVYSTEKRDNGLVRYYIYAPSRDGDMVQVTYRYMLPGVCQRYGDVGVLNFPLLGDGWEMDIERFNACVSFEGGVPDDVNVRMDEVGMTLEQCTLAGDAVRISGTDAGDGAPCRVRLMFPQELLSGMDYTDPADMRAAILTYEAEMDALTVLYRNVGFALLGLILALSVAMMVAACRLWARDGYAEKRPYVAGDPLPIAPGVSPAELKTALSKGGAVYSSKELAATLLDLTRRGYLSLQGEGDDMAYLSTGKPLDDCAEHERYAMEWILGLGDGMGVTLKEIERQSKKSAYGRAFDEWQKRVVRGANARGWYLKRTGTQITVGVITLVLAVAVFVAGIWLADMGRVTEVMGICLLCGSIALIAAGVVTLAVCKHTPEGAQLAADWGAVRTWMRSDWDAACVPADVALWEQLMVYALVLGADDRLARRLEQISPDYAQAMTASADAVLLRQMAWDSTDVAVNMAFYGHYCRRTSHSMRVHTGSSSSGGGSGSGGGGGGGTF